MFGRKREPSQLETKQFSDGKLNTGFIARDIRLVQGRLFVDWERFLHPFRDPKIFTTQNSALTPSRFSRQELVEIDLFVVPNVKDPFYQRGEALAIFF